MRRTLTGLATVAVVAVVTTMALYLVAGRDRDGGRARCVGNDPAIAIAACTALIRSAGEPPTLAVEHNDRGVAYSRVRRPNDAIADYGKAIVLKPDYARAYNNRAWT